MKQENGLPQEQHSLVIMDTFKGQDILKEFCSKNRCEMVIVPHNLTNKFQPLDLTVNKAARPLSKTNIMTGFQIKMLGN